MTKLAQNLFALTLAIIVAGTSMTAVVTVPDAGDRTAAIPATDNLA
ncbi:hypothetical protein [Alteriqipengyuania lutimaris]|nr:hypothetical protein [Alteriqipengyuania lutimaris]MBB3034637.1 hypothetical protein [Alteriqipengyuania lutimaris]